MKKFLLALFTSLTLLSCSTDDMALEPQTSQSEQVQNTSQIVTKTIQFDTEDNMVKVDGVWYHNSNLCEDNFQYLSEYGFRWYEGFLYLHYNTEQYDLVNAEMVNFPYAFYLSADGDNFYIESPYFDQYYVEKGDQYYIKLTLRQKQL